MILSIDYDNTYTADPMFWNTVISSAKKRGHRVYCCTMRRPYECDDMIYPPGNEIIFTGRKAKKPFMESLGIKVDIWIDNSPAWIFEDAI